MGGRGWKGMGDETTDSSASRVSSFAVSGRRHKLNDREGALKSEARRGKRIIYSPRRETTATFADYVSDALIRDGCFASGESRVSHFAFQGRLLKLNIRINYNIAPFSHVTLSDILNEKSGFSCFLRLENFPELIKTLIGQIANEMVYSLENGCDFKVNICLRNCHEFPVTSF